ncbi:MAG: hypothetical protein WCI46_06965 [Verrucomicrobiota bacterium]
MNSFTRILCLFLATSLPTLAANPSLTIYNGDFAVIRQSVPLALQAGPNQLSFSGVTAQLEPDSVILRDPSAKFPIQILEQNYRNDPLSQELLLSLFENQSIDFILREPQKPDRTIQGKVVRSGYVPGGENIQPIIEVNGKLQFSLPGEPRFPTLGADTQLHPSLTWKIHATAPAKVDAELAYISAGFSWEATYNIIAPENADLIDLVGWVTLKNDSGTTFDQAKIKLVAGDVHKLSAPSGPESAMVEGLGREEVQPTALAVTEKSFDEFHLYTLARTTTLRDKESKQVEFLRASAIKATRLFIYDPVAKDNNWQLGMNIGENPEYGTTNSKKIAVYREFKNTETNHLGIPLPKGRVRFYSQDDDRQLEFIGENLLDHTPKDELVRLYVGESFDLVGERQRLDFKFNEANHTASESFQIKLRNRKSRPTEIRIVEHLYRWSNWTIKEKSQDFRKTDAQTIEFKVSVKPNEEKVVTYKVHYTW